MLRAERSLRLGAFLDGLSWHKAQDLLPFFARNARFVDVHGRRWNREEIAKEFVALWAPYARKNTILASMEHIWIRRMNVVLVREDQAWALALTQVAPLHPPSCERVFPFAHGDLHFTQIRDGERLA
jgi:hypothetical protein